MPFSDIYPPIVVPECESGRRFAHEHLWSEEPDLDVVFCNRYEPAVHAVYEDGDFARPHIIRVCGNRERSGVRDRQWCYRCMAGYPYAPLYKEDKDRLTNTAIHV